MQDWSTANEKEPEEATVPHIDNNFVRAGDKPPDKRRGNSGCRGILLRGANDWKVLVDLDDKMVYPQEIFGTPQRPDIVIWSVENKRVLNMELTCPAEEGIEAANTRKEYRYFPLKCVLPKTVSGTRRLSHSKLELADTLLALSHGH